MIEENPPDASVMEPQALPTIPKVPKLDPLLLRLKREAKTRAPAEIDSSQIEAELRGRFFGMRCMMSIKNAGFKTRQGIQLTDDEIQTRADLTLTLISNEFMGYKAAQDVLVRHGLMGEFKAQFEHLLHSIGNLMPQISDEQKAQLKSMLDQAFKGAPDATGFKLSDTGGSGNPPVGQGSVLGDSKESAG